MPSPNNTNRKPTHRIIAALPRGNGDDPFYQDIGAGWESEKGTIWLDYELIPADMSTSIGIRPIKETKSNGKRRPKR